MALPSLAEIKQRKVVQWGLAYLGGAWLALQLGAVLDGTFGWPDFVMRALTVILVVGFLVALVVAWYHGERGAQKVSGVELAILIGLLVVAGLGVMIVGGGANAEAPADAEAAVVGLPEPGAEQITLAVLPFESIGGDGVFAAGLTDELLATLARVPSLRVSARTSASVFQNVVLSSDSLGRALGVAHLVEGTVRESEGRLRVTARLVDAASGLQEWSETYDRDVADLFAVQEEIARAVAFQLRVEIGSAALVGQAPSNPEAFALVVRGRQLMARGGDDIVGVTQQAKRLFEEAIVLDSTYAPAWAGLARARLGLVSVAPMDQRHAEREQSLAEAKRARALDPNEASAHLALAVATYRADPEAAKAHFERAAALNPADAFALSGVAYSLQVLGDEAGAIRMAERVATLDPLSPDGLRIAALIHSSTGRHERAVELGRAMLALVPEQPYWQAQLANLLAPAGETEEAVDLAERAVEADPRLDLHRAVLAYAYAHAGDRAAAERVAQSVEAKHYVRGFIEAALGDRDAAFAALERSVDAEEEPYIDIPNDNAFLSLHDDPRWEPLVVRIRASWWQN